jgi:hypothetical protein
LEDDEGLPSRGSESGTEVGAAGWFVLGLQLTRNKIGSRTRGIKPRRVFMGNLDIKLNLAGLYLFIGAEEK